MVALAIVYPVKFIVKQKKIKNYYKKTAVDGKCSFENEMFLGMMLWRVDQ